jgi:tetratricopeptide (TPR) repeat protein
VSDAARSYETFRQQGVQAIAAGDLHAALAAFDAALEQARAAGDAALIDRAYCNRALPAIELGDGEEAVRGLRQLLLRSDDLENRYLASYHIARVYELRKEYKKGLFYARAAMGHAVSLGNVEWKASSSNQLGNLLLAESQVAEAHIAYSEALAGMPGQSALWQARILDNLGYCEVLRGQLAAGFALLYRSLRAIRRAGADYYEISTRLDLCFAHLEAGRARSAMRHGERALELSERHDDRESLKNALYLLGEAAGICGEPEAARGYFARLQRTFYPDNAFVTDFLLAVDVRKLINLKA